MRDELWKLATKAAGEGNVIQLWSERGPQGFTYRSHGDHDRVLVDVEGVTLVRRRRRPRPETGVALPPAAPTPAQTAKPGDAEFDLW